MVVMDTEVMDTEVVTEVVDMEVDTEMEVMVIMDTVVDTVVDTSGGGDGYLKRWWIQRKCKWRIRSEIYDKKRRR